MPKFFKVSVAVCLVATIFLIYPKGYASTLNAQEVDIMLSSGEAPPDSSLKRYVQTAEIHWPESNQPLDLAMKVAVIKLERGIELSDADIARLVRFKGSGGTVETEVEKNRATIQLDEVVRQIPPSSLGHFSPNDLFPQSTLGSVPLRVAAVIAQNHSAIFRKADGSYIAIQYGGGIVYSNFRPGALFWLRSNNRLIRARGDQEAGVIRLLAIPSRY